MGALAVLLGLALGFSLLSLGWLRRGPFAADILLRVSLSAGYGIGILSIIFFIALVYGIKNFFLIDVIVLAVLIAVRVLQFRLGVIRPDMFKPGIVVHQNDEQWPAWLRHTLSAAFAITLLVSAYAAVVRMQAFPHGDGWDAFTIWNLHARFLFLGGAQWREGFTPLSGGSHPDYPLLTPAAIAHFWTFLGHDNPIVPAMIGIAFTFATAGVLFASLSILRGRMTAMMAGVALLSTPFFIEQGSAQYADVPLSFFYLATVVLLCLRDGDKDLASAPGRAGTLVLAGFAAGFAAWTKNEGLLFLCSVAVARLALWIRPVKDADGFPHKTGFKFKGAVAPLLAALLPGLFLVAYYKHMIAVPGDLFSDPATAFSKLLSPARYWTIFAAFVKNFFRFGHWLLIPGTLLLAGLYIVLGRNLRFTRQPGFHTAVMALFLTWIGYFAVYLITPYDIYWHLRFSLGRLLLQLWPSAVFLFFLSLSGFSRSAEPDHFLDNSRSS
jgi:hypothetical protein